MEKTPVMQRPNVRVFESNSSDETEAVGSGFVSWLTPPRTLILRGDLGAGKTTLVKGIATALEAADSDEVTSPTFTLVHEYAGKLKGVPIKLMHLDLYRLDSERQIESLGLDDLETPDAVLLIEWGEKFKSVRKRSSGEITVESTGGDTRRITVTLW